MGEYYKIITEEDHLEHYGVKGMKWDLKFRKHNDDYYRAKGQRRRREITIRNIQPQISEAMDNTGRLLNNFGTRIGAVNKEAGAAKDLVRKATNETVKLGKKMGPIILRSIGHAVVHTNPAVRGAKKMIDFVRVATHMYRQAKINRARQNGASLV